MKPLLLTTLCLSLTACQSDKVCFTKSPPYPTTTLRAYSSDQVRKEATLLAPGAAFSISDRDFEPVSFDWLREALPVWRTILWEADYSYSTNITDCENFARIFSEWIFYKARLSGRTKTPLVGVITVHQTTAFETVPAGGIHALIAVATDRGIFIIEPQPSGLRLVALAEYPNKVFNLSLGGL